jgi:hypothetical protein
MDICTGLWTIEGQEEEPAFRVPFMSTGFEQLGSFLRTRMAELEKMSKDLEKIDVRTRPIVEGKIQLDVIFDGFRIFSMMMLKEMGLCFRILKHFQMGIEMIRKGQSEHFDRLTQDLLEELKNF